MALFAAPDGARAPRATRRGWRLHTQALHMTRRFGDGLACTEQDGREPAAAGTHRDSSNSAPTPDSTSGEDTIAGVISAMAAS